MKAYLNAQPGKGVGAWKQTELADPTPGDGEVLIGVKATSLNFRDFALALNRYPTPPKPDCIPLSDGAGEVLAVGAGVTDFHVGDRVMGSVFQTWFSGPMRAEHHRAVLGGVIDGMLAQKVVLPATGVVQMPAHLGFEEAATLPCAGVTAWHALRESGSGIEPGSTVLTLGSGGVSVFAIQIARALGCHVISTTGSDDKMPTLSKLGANHVINYKKNPAWHEEVLKLTDGEGVDQVIEVGGAGTLSQSLLALKTSGAISVIGVLSGVEGQINPVLILMKSARVTGMWCGPVSALRAVSQFVEQHRLKPVVDQVFEFDRANEALARLASQQHVGKIVVRV